MLQAGWLLMILALAWCAPAQAAEEVILRHALTG